MKQPFMKLWVSDFIGDTLHLTAEEIGQYMLLLMAMWNNGGWLPNDPTLINRIARGPVADNVLLYFTLDRDDGLSDVPLTWCWRQRRLTKEIETAKEYSVKQSENAKARWLKDKGSGDATASVSHMPNTCYHSHSHIKEEIGLPGLDEQHQTAVIEHRKKLKKPLTAHAAKLLASKFAKCPDPNAAADTMIANGWQGFEPEWLENRKTNGSGDKSYVVRGPVRTWAEIQASRKENK